MIIILIAALIGAAFGGFRGLIIGALIGAALRWGLRVALRRGLVLVQKQFLESTFAVMGALCKADGVVTRDEIQTAERLFERLQLGDEQRERARRAFERGKAPEFDLDAEVTRLARVCRRNAPLLQMFLQLQLSAIAADGQVHPAEHDMLVRVARGLGLSEADVARLEALLRSSAGQAQSDGPNLDDAYAVLGVSSDASDDEVKRAYRRLMNQNHPDKLAGKGLPENMQEMAEEKTREIARAYKVIKEARQMT